MAHDGLARCIDPVHTASDGDTLFALATGGNRRSLPLTVLGALAAEVTQRSAKRRAPASGVREPPIAQRTRPRMGMTWTTLGSGLTAASLHWRQHPAARQSRIRVFTWWPAPTRGASRRATAIEKASSCKCIRRVFLILAAAAALLSCATLTPPDTSTDNLRARQRRLGGVVDDDPVALRKQRLAARSRWWRSTCRTRLRATTTPSRSKTAARPTTRCARWPPRVARVLKATGAKTGRADAATRAAATPSAPTSRDGGGVDTVSHAILGGTPNHGIWAIASYRPNNEFNGAGPYLTGAQRAQGA